MKHKATSDEITVIIAWLAGVTLVCVSCGWIQAVGVTLMFIGHNLERHTNDD